VVLGEACKVRGRIIVYRLLFDKDKPHFAIWVWLYDMDDFWQDHFRPTRPEQPDAVPLYYAALCGFRGLVERLLTAHPQDLNANGGDWGSPLNAALSKGHLDIALFLLDRGADVENGGRRTALYSASSFGDADIVRSLIDRGADLNAISEDGYDVKWTPLHVAIKGGRRDIAILLLERGADTETRDIKDQTALYMASSCGYADVVRSLVDRGADLNAICQDHKDNNIDVKWTPLLVAIYNKRRDIAILLLERGADTETRGGRDENALYMASSYGCADVVQQLLSHGADLNAESYELGEYHTIVKWTPLHVASRDGTLPIAKMLLEHGANPNAPDLFCRTALHVASSYGNVTIVESLLGYGANVDVRDKEGRTPLHEAAYRLELEVVVVLLRHGADKHAHTNEGETPVQLATAPGSWVSKEDQAQIIRLLSER